MLKSYLRILRIINLPVKIGSFGAREAENPVCIPPLCRQTKTSDSSKSNKNVRNFETGSKGVILLMCHSLPFQLMCCFQGRFPSSAFHWRGQTARCVSASCRGEQPTGNYSVLPGAHPHGAWVMTTERSSQEGHVKQHHIAPNRLTTALTEKKWVSPARNIHTARYQQSLLKIRAQANP